MSNRISMTSIMDPIGAEQLELFALEFGKNCCIRLCLLSNIYKYKLGHNVYKHEISDEFDYGSSHTRSVSVICP